MVTEFPAGDGEMARRIRGFDWSATSLGLIDAWPISLRTIVGLLVASSHPMVLLWGPDGVLIYNDGYARFAGAKHPAALGLAARDAWPEIADFNESNIRRGLAGEAWSLNDQQLDLNRDGRPQPTWLDLSYAPVPDNSGRPAGVLVTVTETTDRVLADRAASAAHDRLDMALSAGRGVGTWDWDIVNDRVYADERFARLYGVDPDLAREGAPLTEFFGGIHPDDADRVQSLIRQVMANGEMFRDRYRLVQSDGSIRWVAAEGRVRYGDDGTPLRFPGVSFDVTDVQETTEALAESEARYRTLFQSMDEGFCVIEFIDGPEGPLSDYVHVEANAAYAENAGIPDVVGQKVRAMVGAEAQEWIDLYKGVLDTGKPIRFEKELEATSRWLELAAFRIEPASRHQVAVLFKDLTARKAAERQLEELNASLEHRVSETLAERAVLAEIVEAVDAFVQVIDPDFNWIAVNRAAADEFERVFGHRPQVGQNLRDVLAHLPEERAAFERIWGRALAGEMLQETMEVGDPAIARNPHEIRLYPQRDAAGNVIGAFKFGYDVTDRLAAEQRLRDAEDALRQSQKMEAVGQLTGGIAHDFNNLLAGISGSLELLGKRLAEGRLAGMERYIDAAQGASQRAAALTQRLLAFSRRQTLDPRPTDVNRLISGMEELVRRSVGPNVEVEVVGAGGLWTVKVDQSQLENALLNLCINARDAMAPDGGRLTIETANKWLDEHHARQRDLPPGQYVSLCVTDTGTGMTPEVIEKVFDPFFTTKPMGQGTGLGLSMIHGFVRQSGGQVRVYSEPGEGTTMCLYLPRHHGEAEVPGASLSGPLPEGGHGETILVIDDDETVRMLVVEVLSEAGYRVFSAEDGPSGLQVIASDTPLDLLITDVGLPGGMNGRQVADQARETRPDLKILFITGYAENAAVGNGLLAPGMEVMTKPFVMSDLALKVTEIIDG